MSKDWPGGWQMPGPGQYNICKCPTPGTAVAPGGGWAQVELTDALSLCYNYYRFCETEYMLKFHFNCYDKAKKAKEKNALPAAC